MKDRVAKILLVDDHPVFRHGLSKLIEREHDLAVCGEAESAAEAIELINQLNPDLILIDLSLNGKPGLELIKEVRAIHPDVRMLVVSMHDETLWAERALRSGAAGYVMKQEKPRTLMAAVRQSVRGESWLSPQRSSGSSPAAVPARMALLKTHWATANSKCCN